jgi:hypothetical protein
LLGSGRHRAKHGRQSSGERREISPARPTLHAAKHDVTARAVSLLSGWIPPLAKVQFFALMTPVAHKTRLPDKRQAKVSRYLLRAKVHVGHVRFWQPPELLEFLSQDF